MTRLVWEKAMPARSVPRSGKTAREAFRTLAESFGHRRDWPPSVVEIQKNQITTLQALADAQNDDGLRELVLLLQENGTLRVWPQD